MSVSRVLSLIVLGLYLIGLFFLYQSGTFDETSQYGKAKMAFGLLIHFTLCLACIWSPDEMGDLIIGRINTPSPGCLVAFMGWVVFVLPLLIFIYLKITIKDFF